MNTFELDKAYVAPTYARFNIEIVSGKGSVLTDSNGKEYIDMGSGIAVNTFGTADGEWVNAVTEQLNVFSHTSNLFYSSPCVKLAQMLCDKTGMKKVFFSNSGAEANECAIKAARKYAENNGKNTDIITLKQSFHGRTLATLAATGQDVFHKDFLPVTSGFHYAEANNFEQIKTMVEELKPAAIMLEVVQGEGGVIALDKDYLSAVYQLCLDTDTLLICDEVQIGNGRSGKLYGYMNFDIKPDIVSTAKGLAGGLPLGATLLGEKVENVLTAGSHGSTFGGNPVCCAAAINVLSRLNDEFLNEVAEKSKYVIDELSSAEGVKSVSGLGLMLGIETELSKAVILERLHNNGVLVLSAKEKIRLLPPLNIPWDLLKTAVEKIKTAVGEQ